MSVYAMVNDAGGFVANVIEWDENPDTWTPPAGHTMVLVDGRPCAPGFTYDGSEFIPPPNPPARADT